MNDPERLLDAGASPFEAELLRAGRADALPASGRRRILAGLGIGGLLTASTLASGVRAAGRGWLTAAGVGAAGAVAIWAGVQATKPPPAAPPPAAASTAPAATAAPKPAPKPPPAEAPEPEPEPPAPRPSPEVPARAAARSSAAERADSLRTELAWLEKARRAFLAKDYARALRLLDDYARRVPKRQLTTEATVLRIETLVAAGQNDAATRLGRGFLSDHPNGPYAQRVRSVIGDPSPAAP